MTNEIKYNGLTVKVMNTVIPFDDGRVKYGNQIYLDFDGENRKFSLVPGVEGQGIWMVSQAKFQTIENFLKGIDNVMNLGNDFQKTKILNYLHSMMECCFYCRIAPNSSELCTFLASICELGVFGTYESQRGWSKNNFSDFFKVWQSTYSAGTDIRVHSATRKEY